MSATTILLTEKEGFEPSVRSYLPYNRLAICRFRPLSHLSKVTITNHSSFFEFGNNLQFFFYSTSFFQENTRICAVSGFPPLPSPQHPWLKCVCVNFCGTRRPKIQFCLCPMPSNQVISRLSSQPNTLLIPS